MIYSPILPLYQGIISLLSHMELHLGLALPTQNPMEGFNQTNLENNKHVKNKRSFEESFGHCLKPLPLLVWSGQPNEEDDRGGKKNRNTYPTNMNNEEENGVVGWPPIKSWRKKKLHQQHPRVQIRNDRLPYENENRGLNSLFVKVKMEGVAIGRKIDLRLYRSYQTLSKKLISMFAKYQKLEEDGATYTLSYQDKEGDWLLAGDVPWQSFIDSVKRLEILRNGSEETI